MPSKQAERNAQKRAAKKATQEEETAAPTSASGPPTPGMLVEQLSTLFKGACIVKMAPKLVELLKQQGDAPKAEEPKKEEKEEKKEEEEEDKKDENAQESTEDKPAAAQDYETAEGLWAVCNERLQWYNTLGLAAPASPQDAQDKWFVLKGLEVDFGPKKARRGNPALDRMMKNVYDFLPQYLHILLVLMCLRSLLFRSWFACLPWLVGYQAASLLVPLDKTKDVPLKFRVAATAGIHALVWLFLVYELLVKITWFELIMLVPGIFAFHTYAAKPLEK
eukprot:TRINITY_DN23_c4_g1_i1.p1 TRINITY_DN23_c4_g1~~TRINITY_DN23_c4_g1_i1.p1  ORF type:complete len:278 (+),score=119.09 TRINITY_DN23_c4_g1_i1:92-925(+)